MKKVKNWKILSVLFLGFVATMFMVGCSCSPKKVNPTQISANVTEKIMFVGDTLDIKYNISPVNSSNCKVDVTVSKPDVVSLSATSFDAAEGTLTVTALLVDPEGVNITFTINGTNLQTSTLVKVYPDPVKLNTVSGVDFSGDSNQISFKNVANTKNYVVNIDGIDYSVTDPSDLSSEHFVTFPIFNDQVQLALNEGHIVKVKAVGDGISYSDGEYSTEFKFIKYAPVENITANNGVVSWDAHSLANRYAIKVNGQSQVGFMLTNSYTINADEAKEYSIEIAACNTELYDLQGFKIYNSTYSAPYVVTKLGTPVLSLNNEKMVDGKIGNSVITFPQVSGATGYKIKVSPMVG